MTLDTPDGLVKLDSESPVGITTGITNTMGTSQDGFSPFKSGAAALEKPIQDFIEEHYFKISAVADLPLQPLMRISNNFNLKNPFSTYSRQKRTTYSFIQDKCGYVTAHGTYQVWDSKK